MTIELQSYRGLMMANHDRQLRELILQVVPIEGKSIGNKALLDNLIKAAEFSIGEEDYWRVRDSLIAEGVLAAGKGRGGSVLRVGEGTTIASDIKKFGLTMPERPEPKSARTQKTGDKPRTPRKKADEAGQVISYRHQDKRKNNPHVGMVDTTSDGEESHTSWAYDPHLDPALQFDVGRAQVEKLIDDALASGDQAVMRDALGQLKRLQAPYLNWSGKAERTSFEVDTVSLHVHERIDPATILAAIQKGIKGGKGKASNPAFQLGLFSAPFENLPLREAIDFYKHERDWANRLIAGDSLLVMNSLLQKESMAGQVQMIYIDPPYGIKYGSNFQPFVNKRDVKDRTDQDLTQEPEMIKAFRDTWELGIHSYLTYLRDRLLLAKELLSESGSVFVQISDENLHLIRNILDEIFGPKNFAGLIAFDKTGLQPSNFLPSICDYIVWYSKNKPHAKYHQLTSPKSAGEKGATGYTLLFDEHSMQWRSMTAEEKSDPETIPEHLEVFDGTPLLSDGATEEGSKPFFCFDKEWKLPPNNHWKTNEEGRRRLLNSNRIIQIGNRIEYRMMLKDFGQTPRANIWLGMGERGFTGKKIYVVQTAAEAIERCLLMTSDPGDLVLDPTCGSGTTAFVAEKWGRRWITCDTSRVAVTLAKQRLMTASFDYYDLKYPNEGLKGAFIYKTVPHIMLKSIANNSEIDEIYERMHPAIKKALGELNQKLDSRLRGSAGELKEWEVPFDFPEDWPAAATRPFAAFHASRQAMQKKMDESIVAHADQEILYDQPQISKTKLRITGPFTVEAVPFPSVLALDEAEQPADADLAVARSGETSRQGQWRDELFKTGIRGKGGQMLKLAEIETLPGSRYIHAVGTVADSGERVAVSFGPEHAALEQRQVEIAMREAGELFPLPKMLVFCAFIFDPEAAKDIDNIKGITALKVQMNTDLLTTDLKKAEPPQPVILVDGPAGRGGAEGQGRSLPSGGARLRLLRHQERRAEVRR
ncbi:MAG: site-specific DNA-methyltransferase [Desulfurivibrionaceae bacterium]|jgi:adenine-specific DNA-methyltransferase